MLVLVSDAAESKGGVGAPQGCGTADQTHPLPPSLSQEGSPCASEEQQLFLPKGGPLTPPRPRTLAL